MKSLDAILILMILALITALAPGIIALISGVCGVVLGFKFVMISIKDGL